MRDILKRLKQEVLLVYPQLYMNNQPRTYRLEIAVEKKITESISYIKSSLNESQYQEKL